MYTYMHRSLSFNMIYQNILIIYASSVHLFLNHQFMVISSVKIACVVFPFYFQNTENKWEHDYYLCDFIFCCLLLWLKSVLFCFLLRFTQSIPVYRFHFQRLSFILEFSIFRNIFLFALLVMHAYKETSSCWRPRVSLFFIYLFIEFDHR